MSYFSFSPFVYLLIKTNLVVVLLEIHWLHQVSLGPRWPSRRVILEQSIFRLGRFVQVFSLVPIRSLLLFFLVSLAQGIYWFTAN